MNGIAHSNILEGAFFALPKAYINKIHVSHKLLNIAANYPDLFDDPTRPIEEKKSIDSHWEKFCIFPDFLPAKFIHGMPSLKMQERTSIIEYLLECAKSAFITEKYEDFIKYLGTLSHLFGDCTQAAHLGIDMNMSFISELVPIHEKQEFENFNYHARLEAVTGVCNELHAPKLLGESEKEIAWKINGILEEKIHYCRRYIIPLLDAICDSEDAEAEKLASQAVTVSAQLTLDAIYSIIRVSENNISEHEKKMLNCCDLRKWRPDSFFIDMVYGGKAVFDANRDVPNKKVTIVPGKLRFSENIKLIKGLGVLPHSGISGKREAYLKYSLPVGVFEYFQSQVGIHPEIGADGAVEFIVLLDGATSFSSGRMTSDDNAQRVSINVRNAKELTLLVKDANNGKTFWKNHAYWGVPLLKK